MKEHCYILFSVLVRISHPCRIIFVESIANWWCSGKSSFIVSASDQVHANFRILMPHLDLSVPCGFKFLIWDQFCLLLFPLFHSRTSLNCSFSLSAKHTARQGDGWGMVRGNQMEALTSLLVLDAPSERHFGGFSRGANCWVRGSDKQAGWTKERQGEGPVGKQNVSQEKLRVGCIVPSADPRLPLQRCQWGFSLEDIKACGGLFTWVIFFPLSTLLRTFS